MEAISKVKKSSISARVFRSKTGEWEDLGVIARGNEPKILNFLRRIVKWLQF